MKDKLQHIDLIDSISDRHGYLRKVVEKLWNEQSHINISNSEWYILSNVYKKQPTISEVVKNIGISRQATHKMVKQMEAKKLIMVMDVKHNRKQKCVQLTPLGVECIEKGEELKVSIEEKIAQTIGVDKLDLLKEILKSDWGLETK